MKARRCSLTFRGVVSAFLISVLLEPGAAGELHKHRSLTNFLLVRCHALWCHYITYLTRTRSSGAEGGRGKAFSLALFAWLSAEPRGVTGDSERAETLLSSAARAA